MNNKLSDSEFKVFKSITKFSYLELTDIEKYINKTRTEMKRAAKFFKNTKEFKAFKKDHLNKNKNDYGIPQGSSISAVYSNVYMIDFDKKINNFITGQKGMYRRYCDDFIVIIPYNEKDENLNEFKDKYHNFIKKVVKSTPKLILNEGKTDIYRYDEGSENIIEKLDGKEDLLDYLGFTFNGRQVRLREKSLFKYYSRAYKKVKTVNNHLGKSDYYAVKKSLYKLYTHLGDKRYGKEYGNFITYARKAHEIFSASQLIESDINNQIKKHWNKINSRIKK